MQHRNLKFGQSIVNITIKPRESGKLINIVNNIIRTQNTERYGTLIKIMSIDII